MLFSACVDVTLYRKGYILWLDYLSIPLTTQEKLNVDSNIGLLFYKPECDWNFGLQIKY